MDIDAIKKLLGKKLFKMKTGQHYEIRCEKCGWTKSAEINSNKNTAKTIIESDNKRTKCPKCGEICEPGRLIHYMQKNRRMKKQYSKEKIESELANVKDDYSHLCETFTDAYSFLNESNKLIAKKIELEKQQEQLLKKQQLKYL